MTPAMETAPRGNAPLKIPLPASAAFAASLLHRSPPASLPWHYENGLLVLAADRVGRVHENAELRNAARAFVDARVDPAGRIEGYGEDEYNLDQINPGRLLLIHPESGSPRIETALRTLARQLDGQPRCGCGGYWHKRIYPDQMWLDGLYMAEPFSIAYGRRFGRPERFEEAVAQFRIMEEKVRDPRTGLLYHAWDESRRQLWSRPETGCSPNFWARGMGWVAMALVDSLDYLPDDDEGRADLTAILGRLAASIIRYQDAESGLWFQVVDQGARRGNYLETSASAMFAYAFAKAARKGLLDAAPALNSAERAWGGLTARMLSEDGEGPVLNDICAVAGLGGTPYRDGSFEYYAGSPLKPNDPKGTGPFLLAALEMETREDASLAAALEKAEEAYA